MIAPTSPIEGRIHKAATWFAANRGELERGFIPTLRERFGLSTMECIQAAQKAASIEREGCHADQG